MLRAQETLIFKKKDSASRFLLMEHMCLFIEGEWTLLHLRAFFCFASMDESSFLLWPQCCPNKHYLLPHFETRNKDLAENTSLCAPFEASRFSEMALLILPWEILSQMQCYLLWFCYCLESSGYNSLNIVICYCSWPFLSTCILDFKRVTPLSNGLTRKIIFYNKLCEFYEELLQIQTLL